MGKGRSKHLISERDRRLFERYYYWTEERRLRFDDTIKKLSEEEFFLSESRVLQILRELLKRGVEVGGKQPPKSRLKGFRVKPSVKGTVLELSLFP